MGEAGKGWRRWVVLAEQGLPREGTCVAVHVDPSSPEATANSVRAT